MCIRDRYQPQKLNEYIGNGQPWDLDRLYGGVHTLPPYEQAKGTDWYKAVSYTHLDVYKRQVVDGTAVYRDLSEQSITITLPPMSTLYFEVPTKRTRKAADPAKTVKKAAAKKTAAKTTKTAKVEPAVKEEKPKKTSIRKAKAEAEPAPEKAPAKRGRKPKAEAAAAPEAAPAKRGRKPKAEPAEAAPAAAEKPARKPRAKKAAKTEE